MTKLEGEHIEVALVEVLTGEHDGRPVIEIQTNDDGETLADGNPDIRVYVNDGLVYGKPVTVEKPEAADRSKYYDDYFTDSQVNLFAEIWNKKQSRTAPSWPNIQSFAADRFPDWIHTKGLDMGSVLRIQRKLGYTEGEQSDGE